MPVARNRPGTKRSRHAIRLTPHMVDPPGLRYADRIWRPARTYGARAGCLLPAICLCKSVTMWREVVMYFPSEPASAALTPLQH